MFHQVVKTKKNEKKQNVKVKTSTKCSPRVKVKSSTKCSPKKKKMGQKTCLLTLPKANYKNAKTPGKWKLIIAMSRWWKKHSCILHFHHQEKRSSMRFGKKGDYAHNCDVLKTGQGELLVYKRPGSGTHENPRDYLPCNSCMGFFFKRGNILRHKKKCSLYSFVVLPWYNKIPDI